MHVFNLVEEYCRMNGMYDAFFLSSFYRLLLSLLNSESMPISYRNEDEYTGDIITLKE